MEQNKVHHVTKIDSSQHTGGFDVSLGDMETLVTRSGDNICLQYTDEQGRPVMVNLKPSASSVGGHRETGLVVPRRNEKAHNRSVDRRGIVFEDTSSSDLSEDGQGNGMMDRGRLNVKIRETQAVFVKGDNFARADNILRTKGHVTISGVPGEGKTSLALMLGAQYQQSGYELVFVEDINRFKPKEYVGRDKKTFLIFDDAFGTVGLTTDIPHLKRLFHELKLGLKGKASGNEETPKTKGQQTREQRNIQTKGQDTVLTKEPGSILVVFTTNTSNIESWLQKMSCEDIFFFKRPEDCNLTTADNFKYSKREKEQMLLKHQGNSEVTVAFKDVYNAEQNTLGFPLMCRLFFRFQSFRANPGDFFTNPLRHIKGEIKEMIQTRDDTSAVLLLMLLCDDKLDLKQAAKEFQNTPLQKLFGSVRSLMPHVTGKGVARAAVSCQGNFFSEGEVIGFSHPIMYDLCASAWYEMAPEFVLENCSVKFLYERVRNQPTGVSSITGDLNFLYVTDRYNDIIAGRLARAVEDKNYSMSVTHPLLKNESLTDKLFDHLQSRTANVSDRSIINNNNENETFIPKEHAKDLLHWAVHSHSLYLAQRVLATAYPFSDSEINDTFETSASCGNLPVMKLLMSKYKINQDATLGALTVATENGYSKMVKYLLGCCQDVMAVTWQNRNLLLIAREKGNAEVEKEILSHICKQVEFKTSVTTAEELLHVACVRGDIKLAMFVIVVSGINDRNSGFTPVMTAALYGHSNVFDLLVSKGAKLALRDDNGDNVLHLASRGGNTYIVKQLLRSLDINVRGENGMTPVMKAALSSQKDVFDLLKSKGANLRLTDCFGNNVLHCASCTNDVSLVEEILPLFDINIRGQGGLTPIMRAAYSGQRDVFDLLLHKGADITQTDNTGSSVFHWACCSSSVHIVERLLPRFDINIRGYNGFTPIMHSASQGQKEVFDFLVSKGADIMITDRCGNNALHWASCSNSVYIVEYLLPYFDINIRGQNGFTPVMNSASHGQRDVFDLLVSKGADLTLPSNQGNSLLYCASLGGDVNIVQRVLPLGNINDKGRSGMTPVMAAALAGKRDVFELLVKNGADVTLTNNDGHNVLHLAQIAGNDSIMKFLSTSHL